ncbi:MAG TPA: hypothetical protein VFN55_11790 [Solirubrobacteraceae bacterium]|nr:hypothetical protein [Solirubrobacteraceae bacterium]
MPHALSRSAVLCAVAALAVTAAGCGSTSSGGGAIATASGSAAPSTAASPTSGASTAGVNPNARETLPPGDIPDTIAYVPYTDRARGITISVPEGWSRSTAAGRLIFTDKLNRVEVFTAPAPGGVTPATVRSRELPAIRSSVKTFALQSITTVTRHAGAAVRTAYLGDSQPDPVTGKVGTLAFERYDFGHAGREVVLLMSSPQGSDNGDPWRIITNSLRFTR